MSRHQTLIIRDARQLHVTSRATGGATSDRPSNPDVGRRVSLDLQSSGRAICLLFVEEMDRAVKLLERLSLLRLSSPEKSRKLLQDSITSAALVADRREELRASNVKPLVSLIHEFPWNRMPIYLREDKAELQDKSAILMNSKRLVEGYFMTPGDRNME